jgi:hypothetical protein
VQKIEKWRVEELSLLLDLLAALLRLGKNPEWANVFFHFNEETELILSAGAFDIGPVKMLVRNIKNCFGADGNFVTLQLEDAEPLIKNALNLEFAQARARLWNALQEMEKRTVEFVN